MRSADIGDVEGDAIAPEERCARFKVASFAQHFFPVLGQELPSELQFAGREFVTSWTVRRRSNLAPP